MEEISVRARKVLDGIKKYKNAIMLIKIVNQYF